MTLAPFALAVNVRLPETPAEAWSLAYIVVFPSLGAYLLWNLALKTTAPGTAGNYLNLIVVFTAVITVALGTPLTLVQIVGGVLVIAGVLLTGTKGQAKVPGARRARRRPPTPPRRAATHPKAGSGRSTAPAARRPGREARRWREPAPGPDRLPQPAAAPPRNAPFMAQTTSVWPSAIRWKGQLSSTRPPSPSSSGR